MDKAEARETLALVMSKLRTRSYDDLRASVDEPRSEPIAAPSGVMYQLEVQVFWDDRQETNLRVMASIDDGGISSFKPLSDDFIIAPDGSFVGE